jgi:hypothetical protein
MATLFSVIVILSVLLFFCNYFSFGQNNQTLSYDLKNETGKKISVYKTIYSQDSVKSSEYTLLCKTCNASIGNHGLVIREDIIAVDSETKDTLFAKTFLLQDLKSQNIIIKNGVNDLHTPYSIKPRLKIQGDKYRHISKMTDTLDIILNSKKNIKGTILSFNQDSLVILDFKEGETKISSTEIKSIKHCGFMLAFGATAAIKNCKYKKVKNCKFEIVKQKFNTQRNYWKWVKTN